MRSSFNISIGESESLIPLLSMSIANEVRLKGTIPRIYTLEETILMEKTRCQYTVFASNGLCGGLMDENHTCCLYNR